MRNGIRPSCNPDVPRELLDPGCICRREGPKHKARGLQGRLAHGASVGFVATDALSQRESPVFP